MSDNHDHKEQRIGLWLAGGAAGLAVLLTLIWSVWGWENGKIEGSPNYGTESASEVAVSSETASAEAADGMASAPADNEHHDQAAHEHEHAQNQAAGNHDDAKVVVAENGAVKFYFATGKADLAAGAEEALQNVLAGVKEGKKAVISGYHDKTGNAAQNAELSKKRAFSVRDALLGFGVPEAQIELRKPNDAEAGEGAEARRVEVVLE